jgi:GTPase SAR1 family protein
MIGAGGVGKSTLATRFMTSEYMSSFELGNGKLNYFFYMVYLYLHSRTVKMKMHTTTIITNRYSMMINDLLINVK